MSTSPSVGVFVNTLALAHRAAPRRAAPPVRAFAAEVGRSTLEALEHQDYPFEDLVETLSATRDPGRNPLFDAFFSLAAAGLALPDVAGLRAVRGARARSGIRDRLLARRRRIR